MYFGKKGILHIACLVISSLAVPVSAQSFTLKTVELGHPANGDLIQVGPSIAVSGHGSNERWLSLIDLKDFSAIAVDIPSNAQFFSKMRLAGAEREQLVFLTAKGVYALQENKLKELAKTSSMFPVVDHKRLPHLDIALDINNSGLSDLLIPDFTAHHLLVQQPEGNFKHYRFAIDAEVQMREFNTPHFMPRRAFPVDINLDNKKDVVFLRDGKLLAFLQQSDGSFSEQPKIITPNMAISLDGEANIRSGEGRSFEGLTIYRMQDFTDLDGDGMADMVIRREKFSSAVEQSYSYGVHYGQRGESGLTFSKKPDARIETEGIQFESIFADVNGDGRKDFYTPSATFSVGTIIRALISGTTALDIQFYLMNEDRSFDQQPNYNQKALADVSISRGTVDLPVFQVAAINTGAKKTLILGEKQEQLRIYQDDETQLFSSKVQRFKTPLPRDGSKVKVIDVNADGKEDLVLPFDSQDKEGTHNQIRLLITQ